MAKAELNETNQNQINIATIIALIIYAILAATFLINYNTYLHKPDGYTWDLAKEYILKAGYGNEPLIFEPDWLRNYATDFARLQGLNLGACDGCPTYWLLTMDDNPPPKGYTTILKNKINTLYVTKLQNKALTDKEPQNLILLDPEITITSATENKTCPFKDGTIGPECYTEDWQKIERKVITAGGQTKLCLFVHPRNSQRINLLFRNVRLGDKLLFETAIGDGMTGGDMSPVFMDVQLDGGTLSTITQEDQLGWKQTSVDTSQYAGRQTDVKLIIHTNDDRRRHFCLDARVI